MHQVGWCTTIGPGSTGSKPRRGIGEDNIRVGIIHDDRFFGHIRGVRPGPERIKAVSRRILKPESGKPVGTSRWSKEMTYSR